MSESSKHELNTPLYIYLKPAIKPGESIRQVDVLDKGQIILDIDASGDIIGVEILAPHHVSGDAPKND